MTRTVLLAALVGLMLVPGALAQENNESVERPDDAAWVEDCPPDMMCASSHAPADDDAPTYGACDGEVCVYDEPGALGPEGCIECSQPPADAEATAAPKAAVPGPAVAAVLAALGLAAVLLLIRR